MAKSAKLSDRSASKGSGNAIISGRAGRVSKAVGPQNFPRDEVDDPTGTPSAKGDQFRKGVKMVGARDRDGLIKLADR